MADKLTWDEIKQTSLYDRVIVTDGLNEARVEVITMSNKKLIIEWDGEHFPEALKEAPPGRYVLQQVDEDEPLTEEADRGLQQALDQLDAGQGRSLADVVREIQGETVRR